MDELHDRLSLEVRRFQGLTEDEEGSEEEATETEEEEEEEEEEVVEEELEPEEGHTEDPQPPSPTLQWMPQVTQEQKEALLWYAHHPGDPLGQLDAGLKASVLHKEESELPNFWLRARQKQLKDYKTRDFVLQHRRLEEREKPLKVAMVGQPNSGKSSIINALLQEDRCIVDDANGATPKTTPVTE
eukprot:802854-Amphidinium_carterae.4